jgi:hypothetical protein
MAPASTDASRVDAEFDLDVRLSSVIRHDVAGAAAQPSAVGCNTQNSPSCAGGPGTVCGCAVDGRWR